MTFSDRSKKMLTALARHLRSDAPPGAQANPDGGPGWVPPAQPVQVGLDWANDGPPAIVYFTSGPPPVGIYAPPRPRPRLSRLGRLVGATWRGFAWIVFPPLGWYLSRQARRRRWHNQTVRLMQRQAVAMERRVFDRPA